MLNTAGITKTKGAGLLTIFTIVFNLAFAGKNFFQGVVSDKNVQTGKNARIIFFPGDKKRGWLALFSTDTALDSEEIVRLYGKRWDIEFFQNVQTIPEAGKGNPDKGFRWTDRAYLHGPCAIQYFILVPAASS
jgi:hypothetical protein